MRHILPRDGALGLWGGGLPGTPAQRWITIPAFSYRYDLRRATSSKQVELYPSYLQLVKSSPGELTRTIYCLFITVFEIVVFLHGTYPHTLISRAAVCFEQ